MPREKFEKAMEKKTWRRGGVFKEVRECCRLFWNPREVNNAGDIGSPSIKFSLSTIICLPLQRYTETFDV